MAEEQSQTKEQLLLQAVKNQQSILQLLDHTLHETYLSEKDKLKEEQNETLLQLTEQIRTIVGKKPKLKEIYRQLEEEYDINF